MCKQARFLLSDSGGSESPAGSVPPSWAMHGMQWHVGEGPMQNVVNIMAP